MTFQNKGFGEMPSSRLDSHRNAMQNGMVEKFTAFTATIFMPIFRFFVTATFAAFGQLLSPPYPLMSNGQSH